MFRIKKASAVGDVAGSDGVFSLLFGNFREALAWFKAAFEAKPEDGQRGINLIYCAYTLAGRRDEWTVGSAEVRDRRFSRIYKTLLRALAEGKLDEKLQTILDGAVIDGRD